MNAMHTTSAIDAVAALDLDAIKTKLKHVASGEGWSDAHADAVEAVGDGVREAVQLALGQDAPVGVHLTGGLDSSLVVAQVQRLRRDERVHTFTAGFESVDLH